MNNREPAKKLIDQISEEKLADILPYLQDMAGSDKMPNGDTMEAMNEVHEMITNGKGEHFKGSTAEFINMLTKE